MGGELAEGVGGTKTHLARAKHILKSCRSIRFVDNVRIFSEFFAKSPSRGGGGGRGYRNPRLRQNQTMSTFDKFSCSTCSILRYNPLLCFYIIVLKLK